MTPTPATRLDAHRERVDERLQRVIAAAVQRDFADGAFGSCASWRELRHALHARIRRAMLDAGMGDQDERGVARVDSAVSKALDEYERLAILGRLREDSR